MPRPAKPEEVRKALRMYTATFTEAKITATSGQRGMVQKYACAAWPEQDVRGACLAWLFANQKEDFIHTSTLSDAEVMAFMRWVGSKKINDEWVPDPAWNLEAQWVQWEAVKESTERRIDVMETEGVEAAKSMVEAAIRAGGVVTATGPDPDAKVIKKRYRFSGD